MVITVVIIGILTLPITSQAQTPEAAPPPANIDLPLVAQDTNTWCWLAVIEMILRTRQAQPPRQCEIIEAWDHHPPGTCCNDLRQCARGGIDLHEIARILEQFGGIYTRYSQVIPPNALYNLLSTGLPVIAQIYERSVGTHAVIIRGLRFERDHSRTQGWQPIVIVNDPKRCEPREISYADFVTSWMDSLVVER